MKLRILTISLLFVVFSSVDQVAAQAADANANTDQYISLLRKDLRSSKKQIIAANITLTDAEAIAFWPVYDRYAAENERINNDRIAVLKEYAANIANLTDGQALALNNKSLAIDKSFTSLRQRFIPEFVKVLRGKNLARFFQIDKRIGLLIDLQIAAGIPIVEP
jgi:murein DD-endopeptidase MepM/ murein hydrolase activator NlpD